MPHQAATRCGMKAPPLSNGRSKAPGLTIFTIQFHHHTNNTGAPRRDVERNAPACFAENTRVLCGKYSSTLRKVQFGTPHAARPLSPSPPAVSRFRVRGIATRRRRTYGAPKRQERFRPVGWPADADTLRPANRPPALIINHYIHLGFSQEHRNDGAHIKTVSPGGPPWMAACRGRLFFRVGRVTGSRPGLSARLRRWSAT